MDRNEINKLIQTFSENGLTCLELEEGDRRIVIKKEWHGPCNESPAAEHVRPRQEKKKTSGKMPGMFEENREADAQKIPEEEKEAEGEVIKAPLVGMFYDAASPDSEPFVRAGDSVKKGQVVGIIEAMKLMNEVTSEFDGVVTQVLVENGQVVEYGQPLFLCDTQGVAL